MSVGIELPGSDADYSLIGKIIYPGNGAVTTSGNYRRYYESGGKRVSHLLDPRTGAPLQNELISVTVFAKDAITADAYDNAIMAMGLTRGLAFVENSKGLAAHFIYRKPDGTVSYAMSKRFKTFLNN
jgi:thiamine biosynthesis lipoprotein